MKKIEPIFRLLTASLVLILHFNVMASTAYEQNIFDAKEQKPTFMYQADLEAHLKTQKPTTYRYFQRLNKDHQRQVYVEHLKAENVNLTDLVMRIYKESQTTAQ